MGQRLKFQSILEHILGSQNVYFQPPTNLSISYPCFIYERNTGDSKYADNSSYRFTIQYKVTYISTKPDSEEILKKLASLPMSRYDRHYTADNLNHDVFNIYY